MAKQDAAAVNTTGSGTQAPTLNFTTADIKGMSLTSGGALVINKTDGSSVTIENFKDLSQQGAKLTLADGQTIDTQKLFDTLSATGPLAETANSFAIPNVDVKVVTLGLPQAGQTTQVTLEPGQTYVLGFDPAAAQTSMEGGNLVISFADGAKLIISGFADVMGGSNPPVLTLAEGRVIDGIKLLDMARMNDMDDQKQAEAEEKQDQQQIAQIAEELAKVEPAAGEAGGAAAANRGGFGYQSAVDSAPLGAPAPVGPLGPTALQFGLPKFDYAPAADVRVATPSTAPSFETEDVQVKEDGSVLLSIDVSSNGVPNVNTTATISGIPAGWTVDPGLGTYDPATGTWTITLLGGGTFSGGPILHPPANSDVDLPNLVVTVTNTNITTGAATSVTGTVDVVVDAVADKPNVDGQDNSGLENTALAVSITGGVTDNDGSETIVKYVVSGVPAGFGFSSGTDLGNGQWEFTPAQLAGLTATSTPDFFGSVPLSVTVFSKDSPTDSEYDLNDNTNQATDEFVLTWKPVVNTPTVEANLGVDDAFVKEDGSVFVAIKAALDPKGSGNEVLTVTVTGIGADWTITNADGVYDAATGTWTITLPAGQNYNGGLTFAPPANSDLDLTGLKATATAYEPASGTSANVSDNFQIITDAVADAPTLDATGGSGNEGQPIAINLNGALGVDTDGSESITGYSISGVPTGFTFNNGTDNGNGTWTFTPAQVVGLTLTPNTANYNGSLNLTATVYTVDTPNDTEYDPNDNTAQATDGLTVTWKPTANPPTVTVTPPDYPEDYFGPVAVNADEIWVKEDGTVFVHIDAALDPQGSPNEILTVTVTGVPASWTVTDTANHGWVNQGNGTWTITMPAGQNYNGGLTFKPTGDSDADLGGLLATASSYEPSTNTTATANDPFEIFTDAVIDAPNLTATSTGTSDNAPIALNITTSAGDTDGSETITKVVVSGVPAGVTLSAGTYDAVAGTWTLTPAQLAGLTMTPVRGQDATYTLKITTYAEEKLAAGSGREHNLTDNATTKTVELVINVKDDVPNDLKTPGASVDETTLHTTPTVTVSNTISANFGSDAPGKYEFSGTAPTGLTSNGAAVDVVLNGNTYTGSVGGETIFTLTLNATTGQYTFNLVGVLDHPEAGNPNESMGLGFGVKATDADGDFVTGTVTITVFDDAPTANDDLNNFDLLDGGTTGNVITGLNADNAGAADIGSKDLPNKVTSVSFGGVSHAVPDDANGTTIKGDHGTLTIKSDGSYTYVLDNTPTAPAQDYNVAMMLDVSGSMGNANDPSSKMALLIDAVQNLMNDFAAYPNGKINVHIVPFGSDTAQGQTFNVSTPAGLQAIISYLEGLNSGIAGQYTNYEAPLQDAAAWLNSVSGNGATNLSYFISDGEPNRYLDNNGNVVSGNLATILADLQGADGSNDIGAVKGLGDVIAVGINLNGSTLANLGNIATSGTAVNVQDPSDLNSALANSNPIGGVKPGTDVFEYVLTDADGDPSTATLTLNSEAPTVLPPSITVNNGVDDVVVKEDGSVFVKIVAALDPAGPSGQVLTVTVTGVQPGWTVTNADGVYNPATGTWTITLAPNTNYNGGLTFKPAANSDVDLSGLKATATATEPVTGLTATKADDFRIITDAVADKPHVDAPDNSGVKNAQLAVNITAGLGSDTDGSETITGYKISGVPAGFSFSAGTNNNDGTWSFTPAQIVGLKAIAPLNFVGSKDFTVTVFNAETKLSGIEVDTSDNTNSASDGFKLTWKTTANPPTVTVTPPEDPNGIWAGANADDIWVKEDGKVFVNIDAKLGAGAAPTEVLTVTVTGVKEGWTVTDTANHGWTTNGNGTWTITLAPGQNYDGGLTFTPPANSDRDLTGLVATAVAYEPSTNTSANANDPFAIFTDAVVDAPNLTAQNANGSDNGSIALTIATSVTDTDGSESITKVVISGVPSDASLSAGVRQADGTYVLTQAQLNGLSLTPARGFNGDIKLTVTSTAKETTLAGNEFDLRDNETSKSVDLTVRVVDGVPTNLVTPGAEVDETNLGTASATVTNTISANFGLDAPGKYAFAGAAPTGLTSNGAAVNVALNGNTYTGTSGGKTIFTLVLNETTGQYTFKLLGTLDHPNANDHNDAIALNFGVKATDADGDAINGTVVINVRDDGVDAVNDTGVIGQDTLIATGNLLANDSLSKDLNNTVSKVTVGGQEHSVNPNGITTIAGANGTFKISADGTYTYTLKDGKTSADAITYTLRDGDGDTDKASLSLSFTPAKAVLIVGENTNDKTGSDTPHEYRTPGIDGPNKGDITGAGASDILIGDVGGSSMQNVNKNYNVVMMLDVSGSMSGNKIAELRDAVKNLLADLNNYQGGTVTIHMVPFGSHVYNNTWGTFTLHPGSTADDYQKVINYVNALKSYTGDAQYTNYEAPLQKANEWLANEAPKGADSYAYFISDGEPNRYLNNSGNSSSGDASTVMGQITGSDGSNEVATLKNLTVEVIGVGIGVNNSTLNNISVISDKPAIDVQDPDDLSAALQGASPLNQLAGVGGDVLQGGSGSDIIYGDAINTDNLARANGINLPEGSGWAVFEQLMSQKGWTEAQVVDYIKGHAVEMAHESMGSGGTTRAGGNDTIYGGAGNDLIFGQEGNDHIYGGAGNDTLYGGSGADTFHYVGNDGHDTIKDFNIQEGDVLDLSELLGTADGFTQAAINNFVFATTVNGNTVISVDMTGSGNANNAQAIATLEGVSHDLDQLLATHAVQTS